LGAALPLALGDMEDRGREESTDWGFLNVLKTLEEEQEER
jgi:hypothetical protein